MSEQDVRDLLAVLTAVERRQWDARVAALVELGLAQDVAEGMATTEFEGRADLAAMLGQSAPETPEPEDGPDGTT